MSTLTAQTVRCRRVIAAGDTLTVQLWKEELCPELPPDLEQALLEAETDARASTETRKTWEADLASLRAHARKLEAAIGRLQHTLRYGPLWAAAAAAFALQRVLQDLDSARESLPWFETQAAAARDAEAAARQLLRQLAGRASEATRIRRVRGRTYTVRLRRLNGEFQPVGADRPDAVPAAIEAARAWLRTKARPRVGPELEQWALEQELRRALEQQAIERTSQDDEFDSFSADWLWEEELRRREAADRILLRSCPLEELREPVVLLLQRDSALQGHAWDLAVNWLQDRVRHLVARGVRQYRIPGTASGRQAAELVRQLGGTPVVFAVPPRGDDDTLTAAYLAAMKDAGGLVLVAGSAVAGESPLYLLDPALAAATEAAPLVHFRWDRDSHRLVETREPALGRRLPWIRFDVAAALMAAS